MPVQKLSPKNIIGPKVKAARAAHMPPLQQLDLLAKLHILGLNSFTQSTLSKIETGIRPVNDKELLILAKALNVDVLWLLGQKREEI